MAVRESQNVKVFMSVVHYLPPSDLNTSFSKHFSIFIKKATDSSFVNPCDSNILKKTFRHSKGRQWTIIEKDVMDEIIYKTDNSRNRLMLELMARGGMRQPMQVDPERLLKSSVKLFSGMLISPSLSDI